MAFIPQDISGQRFGRLVAIKQVKNEHAGRAAMFLFKCDCGNYITTRASAVRSGHTKSCGCLQKEKTSVRANKHGGVGTRLYSVYKDFLERCFNPASLNYKNYGARNITVCNEWLGEHGFENFREWAYANGYDETAPRGQLTIDRINVDGNYEPSNCRWADMITQANNTTRNVRYDLNGKSYTIAELARLFNIKYQTLYYRLRKYGWSVKEAVEYSVTGTGFRRAI